MKEFVAISNAIYIGFPIVILYIVLSFFNMYKVVTFFYKSMNKINGVSAFLQKRYIFKIISSKKYSTVFNDFFIPSKAEIVSSHEHLESFNSTDPSPRN